jgi:nitroimidazol reductase NimA-like FMN-containing flavoprotein (pyridoxamine 5'-phosphate oxidase superfamily)
MDVDFDRNGLEIIAEDQCWQILDAHLFGRLVVCMSGRPEVFPLNYVVDHSNGSESLVFLTNPGTKVAGVLLGSQVAFEVDGADPLFRSGWSVVVRGVAVEVQDEAELREVKRLVLRPWGPGPKHTYLRLVPESATGRRIPAMNRK